MATLLRVGSVGQEVREVQDVLNYHIRRFKPLVVDGKFGTQTDLRVREFQKVNKLKKIDGIVGPETRAALFEETHLPVTLVLVPTLQLTLPGNPARGIQPPRLIPPLQWPVPSPGIQPSLINLRITPTASAALPSLGAPANGFQLTVKFPSRKDPADPNVAARQNLIEMLDDLPVDSKFKAFLIGQVPNPATTISPPSPGFKWGVDPVFDPFDPKGFGVKGNAAFTVQVTRGNRPDQPHIVVGAWGDGRVFLDFTGGQGKARPNVEAQGQMFLGIRGVF